ncbi:G-PROTEIN-RECEP-F1-2 domain-containing protein [Aphelenchoides fujianensis]|nr:G-PROTEIN-RECEP-F1-2 domain-containing protein [Aphelenchoides fujianensis]
MTQIETSRNFTTCFGNISDDNVGILKNQSAIELNHIYKLWQGWVPLPLAVAGLLLTSIYIAGVFRAIKQHRVSRKCYVLLLNRAFGDLFACVMACVISIYTASVPIVRRLLADQRSLPASMRNCSHSLNSENTSGNNASNRRLLMASFWSAMISYVALSLIKLYAVWQPLDYRKNVSMRRCVYLIVLSWIVFGFFVAYALGMIALVRIPYLNEWSGCLVETCLRYMYRVRNVTLILIRRARKFMRRFHQQSTNAGQNGTNPRRRSLKERFPLWKLSVNVSTCFFLLHFNKMMLLLGFVRISLLVRIVTDPIVAFITDIRRAIISLLGLQNTIRPMDSKKRRLFFGRSQRSEDNSSDADLKHVGGVGHRQSTKISHVPDRASVEKESGTT